MPRARQVYPLLLSFESAPVEVVQSFKYLGVELHSTKGLGTAAQSRMLSGERAQMALITRCRQLGIQDPGLQMRLWDAPCPARASVWCGDVGCERHQKGCSPW